MYRLESGSSLLHQSSRASDWGTLSRPGGHMCDRPSSRPFERTDTLRVLAAQLDGR
jgi:hypothetical protein